MITYFVLKVALKKAEHDYTLVSVCLLISAGTFLYVATMHVIPEVYGVAGHDHHDHHGHHHDSHEGLLNGHDHKEHSNPIKLLDTAILTLGTFVPLLISLFLDEHGH